MPVRLRRLLDSETALSLACSLTNFASFFIAIAAIGTHAGVDRIATFATLTTIFAFHCALDFGMATTAASTRLALDAASVGQWRMNRLTSTLLYGASGTILLCIVPMVLYQMVAGASWPGAGAALAIASWMVVFSNGVGGLFRALGCNVTYQRWRLLGLLGALVGGAVAASVFGHPVWTFAAWLAPQAVVALAQLTVQPDIRAAIASLRKGPTASCLKLALSMARRAWQVQLFQMAFAGIWAIDVVAAYLVGQRTVSAVIPIVQKLVQPAAILANITATNLIPALTTGAPISQNERRAAWVHRLGALYVLFILGAGCPLLAVYFGLSLTEAYVLGLCAILWAFAEIFLAFSVALAAARQQGRPFMVSALLTIAIVVPAKVYFTRLGIPWLAVISTCFGLILMGSALQRRGTMYLLAKLAGLR